MSLLEDVFLQDEADEAQDLERVIEGDELEDGPLHRSDSDNDSVKGDDEAEEEKQRVDPSTKPLKIVKNPRFVLNPARLTGPRGIQVIPEHFKDFKFKGKGHEKEDLDIVLKKLEHWAYRLYPKLKFEDCLKKIETLGKKRQVMVHLHKIRTNQYQTEETVVQQDSSDDETPAQPPEVDEFDKLLQQQIHISRMTPAPSSAKKAAFSTPAGDIGIPFTMPKATSSPSINDVQRERMLMNKRLAEERRLAKLKQNTIALNEEETVATIRKKHNKSNVIESDDEDDMTVKQSNDVPKSVCKDNVREINEEIDLTTIDNPVTPLTVNSSKFDRLVDLTETDMDCENAGKIIINKKTMSVTRKKQNKSNAIESDDEDDITVKQSSDVPETIKKIKISVLNEENIDLTTIYNPITPLTVNNSKFNGLVDLTEINVGCEGADKSAKAPNRSNVIDSSDDECDMTSVNQSITVDVHKPTICSSVKTVHNEDNISGEPHVHDEEEVVNKQNEQNVLAQDNNDLMDVDFSDDF